MGTGIAQIAAAAGESVLLFDTKAGAAEKAVASIGDMYRKLAAKGKMSDPDAVQAHITVAPSIDAMKDTGLVVEAIVEDLDTKRDLFANLEAIVGDNCILASNTSSISITLLAAKLMRHERVVGMHFFNPVPLMELVEVVKGLATSDSVAEQVFATAARWGKTPVYAKSTAGLHRQPRRPSLLRRSPAPAQRRRGFGFTASIDAIMREAGGFRGGPFELMDLIGHDTNLAVTRSIFNAYFNDPRFTPSLIQQELVEAGRPGRKSYRGFFDYADGATPTRSAIRAPRDRRRTTSRSMAKTPSHGRHGRPAAFLRTGVHMSTSDC